ncbi:FAD/NAD(P)-binding domain-containing protein [Calocera viscosa TUFC12733]|uniref:FAD/NAD(P)-binding domain-containing protein n=1 Tax=Calocera viscosa (strain TUFC12733) TaxID=1330018 RepID=A0A167JPG7_CALVF|nr:FAD/NAD(P)-binding domain-containing protein [Calocera viscosa TUFC12733]
MDTLPASFDVLLLGTSLPQAILAAALSTSNLTVLHVDPSPLYGSHDSSLTLSDLLSLPSHPPPYLTQLSLSTSPTALPELKQTSREYALSLRPMLIRSFSPLIDALVGSRLSKQCAFQLLQGLFLYSPASPSPTSTSPAQSTAPRATKVPASKEAVFTSPLPLLQKRKLMRFLLWAASPQPLEELPELQGREEQPLLQFLQEVFAMDQEGAQALTFVVAQRVRTSDPALPGLRAIRQHLLGSGRYGPSAYLLGHYGGAGELAQLFCRMAAVRGTPYILQHPIERLDLPGAEGEEVRIKLEGIDEVFRAKKVVMEPSLARGVQQPEAGTGTVQCLAILEETLVDEDENFDTALLVFPPGALGEQGLDRTVTCLWTGEGSKSTPNGRYAVYLSTPCDAGEEKEAKKLLEPYLQAFVRLTGKPEQEPLLAFYYKFLGGGSQASGEVGVEREREGVYVLRGLGEGLVDGADRAAERRGCGPEWKIR